jgi:thiol-disulfide isomerase/thioredoxin
MLAQLLAAASLLSLAAEAPFQELTFDAALAVAKRDSKVVMVDFFTTWCLPCKKLDKTTWKDADVQKWIGEKTVALKVDAEKEVDLAKRYSVGSYPTILFLKPDGGELGRIEEYKTPADFLAIAKSTAPGKDDVGAAKTNPAGHENDPADRHDHAKALAQAGKNEEALAEYLWCFDHGNDDPANGYATVRSGLLLGDITRLGRAYPPAIQALEVRRDRAEAALLSGKGKGSDAQDVAALNRELRAPEKSLALYDKLKKENRLGDEAKAALIPEIAELLVGARRYAELIESAGSVERRVNGELELFQTRPKSPPNGDEQMLKMMQEAEATFREMTVRKLSLWYEALLGAGKPEQAAGVAEKLIAFAPAGSTYANLIERALHADAVDAARGLADRGRTALTGKEKTALEAAAKKIPAAK